MLMGAKLEELAERRVGLAKAGNDQMPYLPSERARQDRADRMIGRARAEPVSTYARLPTEFTSDM